MKRVLLILSSVSLIVVLGYAVPESIIIPVQGASPLNWNPKYYWECPWCTGSRIHYGIDILHPQGTPIVSATHGLVIFRGWDGGGGNVVMVLGPHWKVHYYAHMSEYRTSVGSFVLQGDTIGLVGNTGASDMPHLHYSIRTLIPRPWQWDDSKSGWQKIFYMNPHEEIMKYYQKQPK